MRLFGKVDGTVDRLDRAGWLTVPFDLAFGLPAPPTTPARHPDPQRSTSRRVGPDPLRSTSKRA